MMDERMRQVDTAVVGGGLAGLAAAAYLARSGRRVALFERAASPGGRAATREKDGYSFNLGPHALYRGGAASRVLAELGVRFSGGVPGVSGGYAIARGRKHALPGGFVSLLTTSLFGVAAKLETARTLAALPRVDAGSLARATASEFLDGRVKSPEARALVAALVRVATYANVPEELAADVAVSQLQLVLANGVLYVDGGWRTLVDGLREAAEAAGARIAAGCGVETIERSADGWRLRVRGDADGVPARAVVVALPVDAAADLLGDAAPSLRERARAAVPAKAACLDVALSRLPDPRATFALGVDRPVYFSVHSAVARLAPSSGALIHVARYLHPRAGSDPRADERELEELLDLLQPGWRELVVERRFLPSMTVVSDLSLAATGGLGGRPGPVVPELPGVYVAGDWVGREGHLADASLASAKAAGLAAAAAGTGRAAA